MLFIIWALILCIVLVAHSISDRAFFSFLLKLTTVFFAATTLHLIVYSIKTIRYKREEK